MKVKSDHRSKHTHWERGQFVEFKLTLLPMCGFTAQLVEHHTSIGEVMGSNLVEALIFFRFLPSNCLNLKKFTAMITLHF